MRRSSATPLLLKLLAPLLVLGTLVLGVWLTGGKLSNNFTTSMLLSAGFIGLLGLVCLGMGLARRELLVPLLGTYVVAAVVLGVYLGGSTFLDQEVDEEVVTAAPEGGASGAERPGSEGQGSAQNRTLASGTFMPLAHPGTGKATVIRQGGRKQVLTLTGFEVDNGPDLRVYLLPGDYSGEGGVEDFRDLGALKGNKGNQQYRIPNGVDVSKYSTAVIWCRAFSVGFTMARLKPA